MVLQEAIDPEPPNFPGDSRDHESNNDDDPFAPRASKDTLRIQYDINNSELPRPIPILGPILGYGERALMFRVRGIVGNMTRLMKRPLTQEEVQATAEHQARALQIASYGGTIGLFGGIWQCYKTSPQYKFPFLKASEPAEIDPNVFGPLKGQAARVARHSLRAAAYISIGVFIGDLFFQGYATAASARGFFKDPRLHEIVESMRRTTMRDARSEISKEPIKKESSEQDQPRREPSRGGFFGNRYNSDDDNMSPKAISDPDLMSDDDIRARELRQSATVSSAERRDEPFRASSTLQRSSFGDRESPASNSSRSAPSSGSVWDRIRQGATTSENQSPANRSSWTQKEATRDRHQGSSSGDSFEFSSSEEEKQLAKPEAQRDFDERVERERRGGDFNDGKGRW